MGNTIASGRGYLLEVGKNCEKVTQFTSDVIITFKGISIYKIAYNVQFVHYSTCCISMTG